MNITNLKEFSPLAPGAKEIIDYDVSGYLSPKTGVTLSSATWSSDPTGLTYSSQTDTTTSSQVLVTVPESAARKYYVKCKMVFSDGATRTACLPMRIVCD